MIRILSRLMRFKLKKFSRIWQALLGIEIPDPFPTGLILPHPYGVVINMNAKIGVGCWIYQNVTIGSDADGKVPVIGNFVTLYAGACIRGDVKIGNNVVVGANAVVIRDIEDGHTAVGIPARSYKK